MKKNWWATLMALGLVCSACAGSGDDAEATTDEDQTEAGSDSADETSTGESSTGESSAEESSTGESSADADSGDATREDDAAEDATALEVGGPVAAGTYTTDLMGTPITLDFDRDWVVPVGDPGAVVFVDPETDSQTADAVLLTRMNSLAGQGEADVEPEGPAMTGPSNDLGAWIEAVGELIVVDGPTTVDLDGATATRYDVRLDPDGEGSIPGGCGPGPDDRCFFVGGTGSQAVAFFIVRTTEVYRMWMIDQGEHEGLLVTAIADEGNEAWLDDRGEAFVASLKIGEPAPHPVELPDGPAWEAGFSASVPAGEAVFPALGGVTATLPEEMFVVQDGGCLFFEAPGEFDTPFPPVVHVAVVYGSGNGGQTPVASVDDFLSLFREDDVVAELGETVSVLGTELTGYSLQGSDEGPPPLEQTVSCAPKGEGSNVNFFPGPLSEMYLGEYDGGVLVATADGFTEEHLAIAQDLFDQLVPTLAAAG